MATEPYFMLTVDLDPRVLVSRARARGLRLDEIDAGYLVHAWLEATFGPGLVRPFSLEAPDPDRPAGGRWLRILGHAPLDAEALQEQARATAMPDDHAAARWETLRTKPMPTDWPSGRRYRFQLRACPTVRFGKGGRHGREGELDAFLAKVQEVSDRAVPIDRSAVYADWLRRRLERDGAARMLSFQVERYQQARMLRRSQGEKRVSHLPLLPDATFNGELEVGDGAAFGALLRNGVGRHRAFGFGMLLLRPA